MFLVIEVSKSQMSSQVSQGIMRLKLPNIASAPYYAIISYLENNGIMVMGLPTSSPAEKTPDEKLIINKWWPKKISGGSESLRLSSDVTENLKVDRGVSHVVE